MRNLSFITDHGERAFGRLLQQFQDRGNFGQLVLKLGSRYQGLEAAAQAVLTGRYLENASGETLNQIGRLVGEPRPTSGDAVDDDDAYRILIYGRIAANTSHGTLPNLLDILGALRTTKRRIYPVFPASLTVNYVGNSLLNGTNRVRTILTLAKAPVSLDIVAHTENPFGFAGDLSASGFGVGEIGESL